MRDDYFQGRLNPAVSGTDALASMRSVLEGVEIESGLRLIGCVAADGEFPNAQTYLWGPGFTPGTVMGSGVGGVFVGQIWGFAGFVANPQNPILAWSADWTTTDFTPRTVSLDTRNTTTFEIGTNGGHVLTLNLLELYPQGFTPGMGVIRVVPSPVSATPLLVLGAVMLRRRRRAG